MERKTLFGYLAILFFAAILFTPTNSNIWIYFLILSIIFVIGWFKTK